MFVFGKDSSDEAGKYRCIWTSVFWLFIGHVHFSQYMFKVNQANKIHSGRVESVYPPFRRILNSSQKPEKESGENSQ